MKRLFASVAVAATFIANSFGQQTARVETKTFESEYFPFPREVFIYTPAFYEEATEDDYDVIYVFDSQWRSRFDLVHSLMHDGCQPDEENPISYIVVGIPSPEVTEFSYSRNLDLLPVPKNIETTDSTWYNSANFKKFLKNEVMPCH